MDIYKMANICKWISIQLNKYLTNYYGYDLRYTMSEDIAVVDNLEKTPLVFVRVNFMCHYGWAIVFSCLSNTSLVALKVFFSSNSYLNQ